MPKSKTSFAQKALDFHFALSPDLPVPEGVDVIFPYENQATKDAMRAFYQRFYADDGDRIFMFGINPGRFGAGITGVAFTDPVRLESPCGIENPFDKKAELSSIFVFEVIQAYGGPEAFFKDVYITSTSPLGFLKDGKNYNYYDSKALTNSVEPFIIDCIRKQMDFGLRKKTVICIGTGKNFAYLDKLNAKLGLFEKILPVPHPRWVMQYRRKRMEEFVDVYLDAFSQLKK